MDKIRAPIKASVDKLISKMKGDKRRPKKREKDKGQKKEDKERVRKQKQGKAGQYADKIQDGIKQKKDADNSKVFKATGLVEDPQLASMMNELYRKNADTGSGSTAAAVRFELLTGQPVRGHFHSKKATYSARFLKTWLRLNPEAKPGDIAVGENVLLDLEDALQGGAKGV